MISIIGNKIRIEGVVEVTSLNELYELVAKEQYIPTKEKEIKKIIELVLKYKGLTFQQLICKKKSSVIFEAIHIICYLFVVKNFPELLHRRYNEHFNTGKAFDILATILQRNKTLIYFSAKKVKDLIDIDKKLKKDIERLIKKI